MTVKIFSINKRFAPLNHSFLVYAKCISATAPRNMEGWAIYDQYGSYDVPFSQSQTVHNDDVDMEAQNALGAPNSVSAVGGYSDADSVDYIGAIVDTVVDVGQHLVPGGRVAAALYKGAKQITGKKRKRTYQGPRIPETPPERMGRDGSDGGDGGPPPPGPGGNTAAAGGSSGKGLCCCPCDPRSLKYYDLQTAAGTIMGLVAAGTSQTDGKMTWSTPQLLNGMNTGTDYNQRVGRKINLRWLRLKLKFVDEASVNLSAPPADFSQSDIRIILVYDKQPNQNQITSSELMQDNSRIDSLLSLNNRHRMIVFFDKTYQLQGALQYSRMAQTFDFACNLRMLPTIYSATSATISSITTGSLYLFLGTSRINNASSGNDVYYNFSSRLCFVDS